MESQPMKRGELGRFVCVAHGGCLYSPHITIRSDGVWVRSPDPDPLNPGSHVYSSAHRACYQAWRDQELLAGTRWEGDPNITVRHGVIHDKRYDQPASESPCTTCGANLTDGSGDGYGGHWQGCAKAAKARLEELRAALRAEDISWGELAELQGLADFIEGDDTELAEAAGIPEHKFRER